MTDTPIQISDTGRAMLTLASTRKDRLMYPPTLRGAAARAQVVRSLLNAGLSKRWQRQRMKQALSGVLRMMVGSLRCG